MVVHGGGRDCNVFAVAEVCFMMMMLLLLLL